MAGVHDGHRQRVKERYLKEGLDGFAPHNALELLLFNVIPQKDTNELAHALIQQFGSFSGVLEANYADLCAVKGMGPSSAAFLNLIPAICRYYMEDCSKSDVLLTDAEQIGSYLYTKFIGRPKERVYLLCLNNKGNIVYGNFIIEGTVNAAPIYARPILEEAMRCQATSVILAHNHPHGMALPSQADIVATQTVFDALETVKIHLIDHFIVSGREYLSMRKTGYFAFQKPD